MPNRGVYKEIWAYWNLLRCGFYCICCPNS